MHTISVKAIVLRALPFKDNQKILTLFSDSLGVTSMILKGLTSKKNCTLTFSQPFCEAEFLFSKGNSELLKFQDGSILDLHLPLRSSLNFLKTASSMVNAILRSQLPGKPSPELYSLLSSFLKQVPLFSFQETLLSCFYLKVLKHEGSYHPLAPEEENEPSFSEIEKPALVELMTLHSFLKLRDMGKISTELAKKIEGLFFKRTLNSEF